MAVIAPDAAPMPMPASHPTGPPTSNPSSPVHTAPDSAVRPVCRSTVSRTTVVPSSFLATITASFNRKSPLALMRVTAVRNSWERKTSSKEIPMIVSGSSPSKELVMSVTVPGCQIGGRSAHGRRRFRAGSHRGTVRRCGVALAVGRKVRQGRRLRREMARPRRRRQVDPRRGRLRLPIRARIRARRRLRHGSGGDRAGGTRASMSWASISTRR